MITKDIIKNAGTILVLINKMKETDIESIKNHTKLDSSSVYMALGWLVRGGNIRLDNQNGDLRISREY